MLPKHHDFHQSINLKSWSPEPTRWAQELSWYQCPLSNWLPSSRPFRPPLSQASAFSGLHIFRFLPFWHYFLEFPVPYYFVKTKHYLPIEPAFWRFSSFRLLQASAFLGSFPWVLRPLRFPRLHDCLPALSSFCSPSQPFEAFLGPAFSASAVSSLCLFRPPLFWDSFLKRSAFCESLLAHQACFFE